MWKVRAAAGGELRSALTPGTPGTRHENVADRPPWAGGSSCGRSVASSWPSRFSWVEHAGAAARCGEKPGDAAAVAAVESVVTAQCRCCGAAAPYRRCVAAVVRQAVRARSLPSTCKSKVKRDALVACPLARAATPCTGCRSDGECDDGNPCTVDRCVGGTCEHGCVCVTPGSDLGCCGPGPLCVTTTTHQHDDHAAPAALPDRCGLRRRERLHGGPLRQRDVRARLRVR